MAKKSAPTVAQVIRFIRSRAVPEGAVFHDNPFAGRRFPYGVVVEALARLHHEGSHPDLEAFDLKGTIFLWRGPEGVNHELARLATRRLVRSLHARLPGLALERLLPEINLRCFSNVRIDSYGTTLGGMLANVYGNSPYRALRDLIDHDEEFASFRDFQPWDMRKAPQETWIAKGEKRDYAHARELTRACLRTIFAAHAELLKEALLSKVEAGELLGTPLNRYGTTLGGMLDQIYGHSPYLALRDLAEHDPDYREYLPAIMNRRFRRRKAEASVLASLEQSAAPETRSG